MHKFSVKVILFRLCLLKSAMILGAQTWWIPGSANPQNGGGKSGPTSGKRNASQHTPTADSVPRNSRDTVEDKKGGTPADKGNTQGRNSTGVHGVKGIQKKDFSHNLEDDTPKKRFSSWYVPIPRNCPINSKLCVVYPNS